MGFKNDSAYIDNFVKVKSWTKKSPKYQHVVCQHVWDKASSLKMHNLIFLIWELYNPLRKEGFWFQKLGVAMPPSGPTPWPPDTPGPGLSSWEPDREQHHLSLALALGVKINWARRGFAVYTMKYKWASNFQIVSFHFNIKLFLR